MKIFGKNLKKDILYIAEIGVNHEGNINRCKKIIKEGWNPDLWDGFNRLSNK